MTQYNSLIVRLSISQLNKLKSAIKNETTTLIISNNEMNDIIKIVKSLKDSGVLLKRVSETIKYKAKEQRGGFLSVLLGTLGASLLENL